MNNWKDSYRKENWAQKFQDNKDRVLEVKLRSDIENALKELAKLADTTELTALEQYMEEKRIVTGIIRKYKTIKYEGEYTEEDEENHEEMIARLEEIDDKIKKEYDEKIDSKFEKLANVGDLISEKRVIRDIMHAYEEKWKKYGCSEEDKKEYQKLTKKLEDLEYQIKKEKHDRDSDSESWNEYREEDEERDQKEIDEEER